MFERAFIQLPQNLLPLVGLALFFGVFCAELLRVYVHRRKGDFDALATLPLEDDVTAGRRKP